MEEASTQDMGNFGKYINVSYWTEDSEESIPLWNLYTPNMKGVRIGLPKFPFKKYHFSAGEYNLSEDVDTYIDLEWLYNSNRGSIVAEMPLYVKLSIQMMKINYFLRYANVMILMDLRNLLKLVNVRVKKCLPPILLRN